MIIFVGETVTSDNSTGTVESWDRKLGLLKISSRDDFEVDDVIKGKLQEQRNCFFYNII